MPEVELTDEEIDELSIFITEKDVHKKIIADILKKLPDSVGEGEVPDEFGGTCVLCGKVLEGDGVRWGVQHGRFVHKKCAIENGTVEVEE